MHRVLVIDDNDDILLIVDTFLKLNNIITKGVTDARDVLDIIESFKPDLILLDIILGDSDGRLICKQLNENVYTSHIPVILFSALQGIDNSLKNIGMADFIQKPFDLNELILKIQKHIPGRISQQEIEKNIIQILVDHLGVDDTECIKTAMIKKDLGADQTDMENIFSSCESFFNVDILSKYLKGDISVADLTDLIEGFANKEPVLL